MAKNRYHYNEITLSYERIKVGFKRRLAQSFSFISASVVAGAGIYLLFNVLYDSPQERQLKAEKEELLLQFELMHERLEQLSAVMADIENRDDNIYRTIFEAEPISPAVRQSGIGGVNRYKNLEKFRDDDEIVIETAVKMDKLAKQLYIQSKSFDEVIELALQKEALLASIPAVQPISNVDLKSMSSGFGMRVHPILKTLRFHSGADFTAPSGTEIYATGAGRVITVENAGNGYGLHVVIDHGYGFQTLYAHMSATKVRKGQRVNRGELIGLVGNTGLSSAPHVHYEVIRNGTAVDPVHYYFNDLTPAEYEQMIRLSAQENQSFD